MSDNWIKVEDEMPPIKEAFKDGVNYHGIVIGWFPNFFKNKAREVILWSGGSNGARWVLEGVSCAAPSHWQHCLTAPE